MKTIKYSYRWANPDTTNIPDNWEIVWDRDLPANGWIRVYRSPKNFWEIIKDALGWPDVSIQQGFLYRYKEEE